MKDGEWGNPRGVGTESEEYILKLWLKCRINKISVRKKNWLYLGNVGPLFFEQGSDIISTVFGKIESGSNVK